MILTGNPGGVGQFWIKARYIDPAPLGFADIDRGHGHRAAFIPSRIKDNRILLANDPGYVTRLHLVGSAALVKAWLDGDWGAVEGAFFDCWQASRHVVRRSFCRRTGCASGPWTGARRRRSACTGSRSPARQHRPSDGGVIPRGCLVFYREWYGRKPAAEGAAQRPQAHRRAGRGRDRTREAQDEKIAYGVLDPAAFAQDGGPSIAERIAKSRRDVPPRRQPPRRPGRRHGRLGPTARAPGGRCRRQADAGGVLDLRRLIRTLPVLQHDDGAAGGCGHRSRGPRRGCVPLRLHVAAVGAARARRPATASRHAGSPTASSRHCRSIDLPRGSDHSRRRTMSRARIVCPGTTACEARTGCCRWGSSAGSRPIGRHWSTFCSRGRNSMMTSST